MAISEKLNSPLGGKSQVGLRNKFNTASIRDIWKDMLKMKGRSVRRLCRGTIWALRAGWMLLSKTVMEGEDESVQAAYLEHAQDLHFPEFHPAWASFISLNNNVTVIFCLGFTKSKLPNSLSTRGHSNKRSIKPWIFVSSVQGSIFGNSFARGRHDKHMFWMNEWENKWMCLDSMRESYTQSFGLIYFLSQTSNEMSKRTFWKLQTQTL